MTVILCNLTADREEEVKSVGLGFLEFSLTDTSSIAIGSVLRINQDIAHITSINGERINYYVPPGNSFSPVVGSIIIISSVFRFASEDIILSTDTTDLFYSGRLSVPSINESFGSFFEKKQIISNANINLINSDKKLSSIFHGYDLTTDVKIELLVGNGTNSVDYETFFSGVSTSSSNFTYDDITFSFTAKDNRAITLETKIPSETFDASLYPNFATLDAGFPVAKLTVASVPGGWAAGLRVKNSIGATAVISDIIGSDLYIYSYSGDFSTTPGSDDISSDYAAGSTTVTAINSMGTNLIIAGDNGHFISTAEDTTLNNATILSGSKTIVSYSWDYHKIWGTFEKTWVYTRPLNITITAADSGYIDNFNINIDSVDNILSASLKITTPTLSKTIDVSANLLSTGSKVVDLSQYNLKILAGQTINVYLTATTIAGNSGYTPYKSTFTYKVSAVSIDVVGHYNTSDIATFDIPIDLTTATIVDNGNLFFSGNSIERVMVSATANSSTGSIYLGTLNSGAQIPELVNGSDTTSISVTVSFTNDPNFKAPTELYALTIKYPTDVVVGSTLEASAQNKPIPILYGDFTNEFLPTVKLSSNVDNTLAAYFSFSNATTGSLDYLETGGTAPLMFDVGDSIEYIAAGATAELISAKITQILPTVSTPGSRAGTVYFENYGIIPNVPGSAVTISRETNVYKICNHPVHSILDVKYMPKSSKIPINLPNTVTRIDDLANGELTLIGLNSKDSVFVSVKGKPDSAGLLIESPLAILNDLTTTYNLGVTITVKGGITSELDTLKYRKYITEQTTFGDLLSSIETDSNVHTYIDSNNVLTILRFTSTLVHDIKYEEYNVVPGSFNEQYDPNGIKVSGIKFLYNYNYQDSAFNGLKSVGTASTQDTMEFTWLYQTADADLIGDQLFAILRKTPEIINCTLVGDNILLVRLGDILKLTYRNSEHILFIYNIVKNPNTSQIDIYGWNLAHGYDIDFTIPDLAEFPVFIREQANWVYQYHPVNIIDPFLKDSSNIFDTTLLSNNLVHNSNVNVAEGVSTSPTLGTRLIFDSTTQDKAFVIYEKVTKGEDIKINIDIQSAVAGDTGYIKIGKATDAQVATFTGDASTDTYSLLGTFTATTSLVTNTLTVNLPTTGIEDNLVIFFVPNGGTIGTSTLRAETIQLYYVNDRNLADDRFNYWNGAWPYIFKKFMLNRHNPEMPPSKYLTDLNGNRENIARFKA